MMNARERGTLARRLAIQGEMGRLKDLINISARCLWAEDPEGRMPAHLAAYVGNNDVLQLIYRYAPATLNWATRAGKKPISYATNGHEDHLEGRMRVICFITEKFPETINEACQSTGQTPIIALAKKGLPNAVRLMQKLGGDVNARADINHGWTALHYAAYMGHVPVIKTLLELGGDVSIVSLFGHTPVDLARIYSAMNPNPVPHYWFQRWLQMSEEQRGVIIAYGWDYFCMPTWRPSIHADFPQHLRAQVCALAVSCNGDLAPVFDLIAKGVDALKRSRTLNI